MRRILIGLAATLMIGVFSWLTIRTGYPKIYAPLNMLVVLPALILGSIGSAGFILSCAIVPIMFLFWSWPVLNGDTKVPNRTVLLLKTTVGLSAGLLILGASYGAQVYGSAYFLVVSTINVLCWLALFGLGHLARSYEIHALNLAFHVTLFSWLAFYAFPYLGELP